MRILIIEDEVKLAEAIAFRLKKEHYIVDINSDGETGLDNALTNIYDLILLDVMLPKMNGFDILKEIKNEGIETKVIMLTAKSMLEDKLYGFESGANDYITKPFHMDELVARVNAQLRNTVKIAKNIVSNYGGNITAHSENEYTTFKVFFLKYFHMGLDKCKLNEYNKKSFANGDVAQLARAFGSYPKCHVFESHRRYQKRIGNLIRFFFIICIFFYFRNNDIILIWFISNLI